ncbi:uncharacterized protein QC764_0109910 [Podospora pseudoanserina]|uniref:Uncharacterized protein n=1 Tax=Podospora pseudoanserina TaxID=2609844 RepID=A0ABR0HID5_9PEZI|nr:hypothetical protein QC764_0109910 [Podospora pseudoanserina]
MRGALLVAARAGTRQPGGRRHSLLELLQFSSFSKQFQFSSFSSSTGHPVNAVGQDSIDSIATTSFRATLQASQACSQKWKPPICTHG